ncbi:hypothetical protein [Streptomyces sp. NPDC088725]|uniref:hypothetical protein n=1 Tax=Streptomyces sp. NPDC088725 TaxID=3365873 RepID=UPI0038148266
MGRGTFTGGEEWEITALAVSPDQVMTFLMVTREGVRVFGAGMGGPALEENRLLSLSWGRSDDFTGLVVRAAPSVARLLVTFGAEKPTELPLFGIPGCDGVRVAGFGTAGTQNVAITVSGRDRHGDVLETQDVFVSSRPARSPDGGWTGS